MSQIRKGKLSDLKFDSHNANTGTEYGTHLLRQSIESLGIGRGIVAAADGTIIGGNHVTEMLGELGIDNVVFVPTDGKTLVVTQRTDIEPNSKAFHELALADNRVGQINLAFDNEVVKTLSLEHEIDLSNWGMEYVFETPDEAAADEEPTTPSKEKISFALSLTQMADLRKALDTSIIENDIDTDYKLADSAALVHIIREYLSRRK